MLSEDPKDDGQTSSIFFWTANFFLMLPQILPGKRQARVLHHSTKIGIAGI